MLMETAICLRRLSSCYLRPISLYESMDIAADILCTILFIVNYNACLSAGFTFRRTNFSTVKENR